MELNFFLLSKLILYNFIVAMSDFSLHLLLLDTSFVAGIEFVGPVGHAFFHFLLQFFLFGGFDTLFIGEILEFGQICFVSVFCEFELFFDFLFFFSRSCDFSRGKK